MGKLFTPHVELGWVPLPNLDLERRNANGATWHVVTDQDGLRGPAQWQPERAVRMLLLGDSFAFGEGVDLEDRFDMLLQRRFAGLSVVNLGVMGYGPDQQLARARGWLANLRAGDILLMLTYSNDFFDLASTTHSGRSKRWLERQGGALIEHRPEIGLIERLRDRSYIFSVVARRLNVDLSGAFAARLADSGELYRDWVLQETRPLLERGVHVVLVHHGDGGVRTAVRRRRGVRAGLPGLDRLSRPRSGDRRQAAPGDLSERRSLGGGRPPPRRRAHRRLPAVPRRDRPASRAARPAPGVARREP